MDVTPDEMTAIARFSIQFTLFLSLWNQAETTARRILQLMLGESQTAMALAVEIQNRSLSNALKAGVKDKRFASIRTDLEHFLEGYEVLLDHRNYHAHSLLGVSGSGGTLLSVSAKGRLKIDRATSTMGEMEKLKGHASDLIGFGAAIEKALGATGGGIESLLEAYEASLQKPTWPERVKKNPLFLQEP